MKKTVFLLSLLLMGMGLGCMGCMPEPKVVSVDESSIPTAGALPGGELPGKRPVFGRFNIHKRHGLGGWEGSPPVISERELFRHLSGSQPRIAPGLEQVDQRVKL